MKLISLTIQNFKGIKDFTFAPNGENVTVYGNNGTGKTTLSDGFHWLFWGKDSRGKADFEIKPLTKNNEPIHNLEMAVEALIAKDGKQFRLRKVFREKWETRRGEAEPKFTGHTNEYFVNGVPKNEREFKATIAAICPSEEVFKMLTNPAYFNEQMKWQDRRKILFDIGGELTDMDVINSDPELAPLAEALDEHTLEEYQKMLLADRKRVAERKAELPVRISELKNSIPHAPDRTAESIVIEVDALTKQREAKQAELERIKNGGEIAQKTKELREAEAELLEIRNRLSADKGKDIERINGEIADLRKQIREIQAKLPTAMFNTESLEKEIVALRERWKTENEKTFDGSDTCPTCKQPLPAWQVEEAVATFNKNKAENLKDITEHGQTLVAELKAAKASNEQAIKQAEEQTEQIAAIEVQIQAKEKELEQLRQAGPVISTELTKAQKKVDGIRSAIGALELKTDELTEGLQAEIDALNKQIQELNKEQASIEFYRTTRDRIQKLEDEQKELADEESEINRDLYLAELFTRKKASLVEESVNSAFKFAKFKLFNELINGGVEECCETLYNGVPYSTGLNTGHKIIVGLDIINTLSDHYGFRPPIFVDNAESVTDLPEMQAQVIRLVKPEIRTATDRKKYSKLVIEGGNEDGKDNE